MKKLLFIVFLFCFNLYAGTNGWNYSNYNYGSYVPKNGVFSETGYSHMTLGPTYESKVKFSFDSTNTTSIWDYNNGGDNPGSDCDNSQAYVTIDVTAVSADWWADKLDAREIYTNLPSAKIDLESDGLSSSEREESEVVALGSVFAGVSYEVITYWNDVRTGGNTDGGNIQVQFAVSKKGVSDYNNCVTSSAVQVINPYDKSKGSL